MPRSRASTPLHVWLNARLVGQLRRSAGGAIEFRYDPGWLEWEHALPVSLSLPLREDRFTGEEVVAVFDNLLPDSLPIRRRIAERTGSGGTDPFHLLRAIGHDCVGALQFLPEDAEPGAAGEVQGRMVDESAVADILRHLAEAPLGLGDDDDFRISIAGAQEKTGLLFHQGRWHVPHGTTATTHILKPQIGLLRNGIDLSRSVENEHFCMRFLHALGLPVATTEIRDFDGERALVVARFDRVWTDDGRRLLRIPQEDLCQALGFPPSQKYQADGGPGMRDIFRLLEGSDDPAADRRQFFEAQLVYWLLGATDGHAKNFSIHLLPGGRFRLAPLYDVMSAQPHLTRHQIRRNKMKVSMSVGGKYRVHDIRRRHFERAAREGNVPEVSVAEVMADVAARAPRALEQTRDTLPSGFPDSLADAIAAGIHARLANLG